MTTWLICEAPHAIRPQLLTHLLDQGDTLIPHDHPHDPDDVTGLIIRNSFIVDETILDRYPHLTHVARIGVGTDNIAIHECNSRDITVINTPGANRDAVADACLMGILMLQRQMTKIRTDLNHGLLHPRHQYRGHELCNHTVGILGRGHIGHAVYHRLVACGVRDFVVIDPHRRDEEIEERPHCRAVNDLTTAIAQVDILTIHIPLVTETHNLIDVEILAAAKPNLSLINTARGGIVDEEALLARIQKNPSASAYVDVWTGEPTITPTIRALHETGRVIITPHIAGVTEESEVRMHRVGQRPSL